MSKFTPISKELPRTNREEATIFMNPCSRFSNFYYDQGDQKSSIIYLKLRSKSCPKLKALTFCSKPICKVDSTRRIDGPSHHRVLKVKKHSDLTNNGWQFNRLNYNMGEGFYTGCEDFLEMDNSYDKLIKKNFQDSENKIKSDFKVKISNLQSFYEEMNEKYDFGRLKRCDLHNKLKQMNIKSQKNQMSSKKTDVNPIYSLSGGIQLKEIIKEELNLKMENTKENIIKRLKVFPIWDICKYEVKAGEKDTINEKKDSDSDLNLEKPIYMMDKKKLKETSNMLKTMELQSKFIKKINNESDFIPNYTHYTERHQKKCGNDHQILKVKIKKSDLNDDYDKANYMFSMNFEKSKGNLSNITKTTALADISRDLKGISLNFKQEMKNFTKNNIHLLNTINKGLEEIDNGNLEKMRKEVNIMREKLQKKKKNCFSLDVKKEKWIPNPVKTFKEKRNLTKTGLNFEKTQFTYNLYKNSMTYHQKSSNSFYQA